MTPGQKELVTAQLNKHLGIRCGVTLQEEHGICLIDPESGEVIIPANKGYDYVLAVLRKVCPA